MRMEYPGELPKGARPMLVFEELVEFRLRRLPSEHWGREVAGKTWVDTERWR